MLGAVGTALWLGAFGVVLLFPCMLAAALAVGLANTFPLYDLLVLGWVVAAWRGWTSRWVPDREDGDPDTRLFGKLARGARNLKGLFMVLFSTVGLVLSGLTIYVGVSYGVDVLLGPFGLPVSSSLGWTALGIVAWLTASGIYGFAVWYAELRRIPAFLDEWTAAPEPTADPPRVPPGQVLPAVALGITTVLVFATMDRALVRRAFGVAWPVGLVAVAWGLHRWRKRGPSGVWGEDQRIVLGVVAHALLVVVGGNGEALVALLAGRGGIVALLDSPVLVGVALLVVMAWLPDIERFDDREHPVRRFVLPGYALLLAGIAWSAGQVVPFERAFGAIAAVCLVGGVALLAVRRYGL